MSGALVLEVGAAVGGPRGAEIPHAFVLRSRGAPIRDATIELSGPGLGLVDVVDHRAFTWRPEAIGVEVPLASAIARASDRIRFVLSGIEIPAIDPGPPPEDASANEWSARQSAAVLILGVRFRAIGSGSGAITVRASSGEESVAASLPVRVEDLSLPDAAGRALGSMGVFGPEHMMRLAHRGREHATLWLAFDRTAREMVRAFFVELLRTIARSVDGAARVDWYAAGAASGGPAWPGRTVDDAAWDAFAARFDAGAFAFVQVDRLSLDVVSREGSDPRPGPPRAHELIPLEIGLGVRSPDAAMKSTLAVVLDQLVSRACERADCIGAFAGACGLPRSGDAATPWEHLENLTAHVGDRAWVRTHPRTPAWRTLVPRGSSARPAVAAPLVVEDTPAGALVGAPGSPFDLADDLAEALERAVGPLTRP